MSIQVGVQPITGHIIFRVNDNDRILSNVEANAFANRLKRRARFENLKVNTTFTDLNDETVKFVGTHQQARLLAKVIEDSLQLVPQAMQMTPEQVQLIAKEQRDAHHAAAVAELATTEDTVQSGGPCEVGPSSSEV